MSIFSRFLIIGDIHWRSDNPKSRTDDYKAALTAKLRECFELASQHGVDAILHTGDTFDSPNVALSTIADLALLLRDSPVPIFGIAGNHDLPGGNPDTISRTPLGVLFRFGIIQPLHTPMDDYVFNGHVVLRGAPFSHITDVDPSYYASPDEHRTHRRTEVRITHGMLTPKPVPGRHTLFSEIAEAEHMPDVIVNGHYHLGTGIQWAGDTLIINPGALCRASADVREIDRTVQVALLEVPANGKPRAKLIPLKSARPGHEVLSREHLVAQAERETRRNEFLDLLSGQQREAVDLTAVVDEVAQAEGVSENVRIGALRRISKAMEALATRSG